ncbi:hypothetical protein M5689_010358 [Euphorbia peplus]|nr:hypothetical protein M5689_010358 [Euphorbia peplus]
MANPRRSSENEYQLQKNSMLSSLKNLLKKPHAFPFLLSIFLLLAWLCFRLQPSSNLSSAHHLHSNLKSPQHDDDEKANLIRFKLDSLSKDNRGWLLNPLALALDSGIKGGAGSCTAFHVGQIQPGALRGNHRHYTSNETFVIWGARTLFRLENSQIVDKGYAEVIIGTDEIAVAASPSGTAHVLDIKV